MTTSKIQWQDILQFDLEGSISEYGFSTRLAYENKWPIHFTQRAIVEYKKFMFLAATSNTMVSPSEIVDTVWHQHLIFTKSYNDFAAVLGKRIDHIPSTHHDGEKEKFGQARKQTLAKYTEEFGTPPSDIWQQHSFYDPLIKDKATWSTKTLLFVGSIIAVLLCYPLYLILKPIIIQIDNPFFLFGFIGLLVITLALFYILASTVLSNLAQKLYDQNFLKDLNPLEVIFMQKGSLVPVVHGITDQLIKTYQVEQTAADHKLKRTKERITHTDPFEHCVYNAVKKGRLVEYAPIVRSLIQKPLFLQLSNFAETVKKKVTKTATYLLLHLLHTTIFFFFFLIGLIRLQAGIERDRPAFYLGLVVLSLIVIYFVSRWQLNGFFTKWTIPEFYKEKVINNQIEKSTAPSVSNWEWEYFIYGELFLEQAFLPVVYYFDQRNMTTSSAGCGSGCGSGCGGGGGGCGGGCGGCGG